VVVGGGGNLDKGRSPGFGAWSGYERGNGEGGGGDLPSAPPSGGRLWCQRYSGMSTSYNIITGAVDYTLHTLT
jgi:hypothetical protein